MVMVSDRPYGGGAVLAIVGAAVVAATAAPIMRPTAGIGDDNGRGTSSGHHGRAAASGVRRLTDGAFDDMPARQAGGTAVRSVGGNPTGAAATNAANDATVNAAEQRVGFVFYRMRAVYRAVSRFASQGSLNPVRS